MNFEKDEINNIMIASNCNTLLNGCDYSNNWHCLAFVSANLIHIYDTVKVKTYLTLKGHSQRANSVKWINNYENIDKNNNNVYPELLSCSSDGSICHWVNNTKNVFEYKSWKLSNKFTDPKDNSGVNYIASLYVNKQESYFATFSTFGNLNLWALDRETQKFELYANLNYKKKLQDVINISILDKEYILLLSGGYDNLINVHVLKRSLSVEEKFTNIEYKLSLQGHTNSIRDIAFSLMKSGDSELKGKDLLFASCSQDTYIRLWSITKISQEEIEKLIENLHAKEANSIYEEYKNKMSYVFRTKDHDYFNIVLDSLLSGHEEPVSSIRWGIVENKNVLLSSSFDFTMSLWKWDESMNLWNKELTLGEMTGNKHAFFSAIFIEDYKSILSYTYTGAMYLWRYNDYEKLYKSHPVVHGHFNSVTDLDWDPSKSFLVTTSKDQTSRIFASWKKNGTWHEINRPQVHGYDINAISCINNNENKDDKFICKIISGADEKVLRSFNPPFSIVKFLQNLSEINLNFSKQKENSYFEKYYSEQEGSKQALGLMNRQNRLEDAEAGDDEENFDFSNFNPDDMLTNKKTDFSTKLNFSIPPDEDFLFNNTLWPENSKLYGHGYEIISIAVSHDGLLIATGGKSQSEKNSKLFLWDANKNNLLKKLDGHALTIVQIEFSNDDKYILTVSRDRSLGIYERIGQEINFKLIQFEKESHARIIWGCSWAFDSEIFLTGSRDNILKIWSRNKQLENPGDKLFNEVHSYEFSDAVTSVNLFDRKINDLYVGLVGLENGEIFLVSILVKNSDIEFKNIRNFPEFLSHGMAVKRIKSFSIENRFRIASCSEDHTVRIFEIYFDYLEKIVK